MVFRGSFVILTLINKREEIDLTKLACIGLLNQRFCKLRLPRIKLGRGRKPTGAVPDTEGRSEGYNPHWSKSRCTLGDIETGIPAGQSPRHGAAVISKLMSF